MSEENPQTLGEWAVWYAKNGFGIIPLQARGKHPVTDNGLKDWTDDTDYIREWWKEHPRANIGIVCGTPSNGLLVIDLDVSETKDGLTALKEWERAYGELPETATAITGSGGRHLLYKTDRINIHPSVNDDLGVDIRCDGSYIVAPPSIHPNGEMYEWWASPMDVGIAKATDAVYDFVDHVQRNGGRDEMKKDNGKFRLPDVIKKGERDNTLFKFAAHLRALGRSDEEMLASVMGVNLMRCDPPMDSRDVERIVKSACRYERGDDGGATSDREIGKPGGKKETSETASFYENGHVKHNLLGRTIIEKNHACYIDGAPAIWTGRRWSFGISDIKTTINRYVDDISTNKLNDTLNYILRMMPRVDSDNAFDGKCYVQFADVTYDIETDEIVEPTPQMLIVGSLPFELDLDAQPNLADNFLMSLAVGDQDVFKVLTEIIGCCICSRRIVSRAPMLIGRARNGTGKAANGKSTFIHFIEGILGQSNYSSLSIADMDNRFNKGMVLGKLANLGDDIPDGYLKGDQLATFKKMVTGDSIFVDVKGSDGYTFRPMATQVFSMNSVPRMSDNTEGIYRRLAFIPFRGQFMPDTPGYDPTIGHKLAQPEVLKRGALLGLMSIRDVMQRGDFTTLPDMEDEIEQARIDNSSVARWVVDECVTVESLVNEPVAAVYERYQDWAKRTGERYPRQNNVFSRELIDFMATVNHDATLKSCVLKLNGRNVRCYRLV